MFTHLRKLIRKTILDFEVHKNIPIGHGYSLELTCYEADVGVELCISPNPIWCDTEKPIKHYVGGISVAPGMVTLTDMNRDSFVQRGRNLLHVFVYGDSGKW